MEKKIKENVFNAQNCLHHLLVHFNNKQCSRARKNSEWEESEVEKVPVHGGSHQQDGWERSRSLRRVNPASRVDPDRGSLPPRRSGTGDCHCRRRQLEGGDERGKAGGGRTGAVQARRLERNGEDGKRRRSCSALQILEFQRVRFPHTAAVKTGKSQNWNQLFHIGLGINRNGTHVGHADARRSFCFERHGLRDRLREQSSAGSDVRRQSGAWCRLLRGRFGKPLRLRWWEGQQKMFVRT